jgi:ABC-type bacteriocin/lantibiotic exporter with double-glycine peptidase domain
VGKAVLPRGGAKDSRLLDQSHKNFLQNVMAAPILETRDISKRFGSVTALSNVSLTIHAGRVHTLLGENGAGKSTLMKILAGVYIPSSGHILIDGTEVTLGPRGFASTRDCDYLPGVKSQ